MSQPIPPIELLVMMTKSSNRPLLVRATVILLAVGALSFLPAWNNAIGSAITNGSFMVDHARVWGNTTLFDGSVIETASAPSQLQLIGGAQVRLAADTRATVYQKKLILESGYGQVESAPGYEVEARTLRVSGSRDAITRVKLEGDGKVIVAAVRGAVRVTNSTGVLVATIEAGRSLDLEPQAAGALAPTKATGCLLEKAGKPVVVDQTTSVVLELRGTDLEREIGNRVEITGIAENSSASVPGASQLIRVAGLKVVAKGGCSSVAKKIGATAGSAAAAGTAGAGTAGAASGIGAGTIAIIGGVAAAATVGGLAAAGSLSGQSQSQPSASR
jgi:hypothetical protein